MSSFHTVVWNNTAVTSTCCSVLSKHKGNCGDTRWPQAPPAHCRVLVVADPQRNSGGGSVSASVLSMLGAKREKKRQQNKQTKKNYLSIWDCVLAAWIVYSQHNVLSLRSRGRGTLQNKQARRLEGSSVLQIIWSLEYFGASDAFFFNVIPAKHASEFRLWQNLFFS